MAGNPGPRSVVAIGLAMAALGGGLAWLISSGRNAVEPASLRPPEPVASTEPGPALAAVRPKRDEQERTTSVAVTPPDQGSRSLEDIRDATHREAVLGMAAFSDLTPEEVIAEIDSIAPWWFDHQLEPLAAWEEVRDGLPTIITRAIVGTTEAELEEDLEMMVLGELPHVFEARWRTDEMPPERLAALAEIIDSAQPAHDIYASEVAAAVAHIVEQERFDRWPYVTMRARRQHSERDPRPLLAFIGGSGGCWAVQLEILRGEFPTLDQAHADWLATRADAESRVQAWIFDR